MFVRSSPDTDSGSTCLGFASQGSFYFAQEVGNFIGIFEMHERQQERKNSHRNLVVCTWNVQTLVETSGDVRICRKRQVATGCEGSSVREVDRKLNLLVGEVKRYGISVAGIQETKWFGKDVWLAAEGFTFPHSGRPLPANGEDAACNEGVGIMLNPKATVAWRDGKQSVLGLLQQG